MKGDLVVYLKDGRQFDLSDLSPKEAVAALRERQIGPEDVAQTVHRIRELHPAARPREGDRP